jgi:hypothetical protein
VFGVSGELKISACQEIMRVVFEIEQQTAKTIQGVG